MIYLGSKNRIAKFILPVMIEAANKKGITTWVEPFCGGANTIDKVPKHFRRIGADINPHTIAALIAIRDFVDKLPTEVSEEHYKKIKGSNAEPINSWIRFVCSFGAKLDGGFARNKIGQNYAEAGVNNAKKQSPNLQDVELIIANYEDFSYLKNCLIFCDPPYKNTTSYKTKSFDHDRFWQWCRGMSKNNEVFISEYQAPEDFLCVWSGEINTNFASQREGISNKAVEKLFKLGGLD